MPSTIWTGAISFGLVTIPVRVSSAVSKHTIPLHQVHEEDGGRIRTRKVCELDGKALRQEEIGRGYELGTGEIVPVSDAELDAMPLPTARAIEIVAFVDRGTIDPARLSGAYYLSASGEVAAKPYVLLRQALTRTRKAAVAKFAWHNRERLGLVSFRDDALVIHTLLWPDELRSPHDLAPTAVDLDEEEIGRALDLVASMSTDGDLSAYRDRYRDALAEVIEAKEKGKAPPQEEGTTTQAGGQIVDLMAALNESVARARETRGDGEDTEGSVHESRKKRTASRRKSA